MVRLTVWLLCGIGVYASARMARTAFLDRRGLLGRPSVVQRRTARLVGGIPNAYVGLVYYPAVALVYPLSAAGAARIAVTVAVAAALVASVILMADLALAAKRPCPNCWMAHACNIGLALAVAARWT